MNWTRLSAIAEILSSIAIVVTLVYLTIEIRQNTSALQASAREAAINNSTNSLFLAVNDPEIWLIRTKSDLTDREKVRLSAYLFAIIERALTIREQYRAGALDEASWVNFQRVLIGNLTYVQPMNWWRHVSPSLDQDFVDEVNAMLEGRPIRTKLVDIDYFE